MGVGPFENSVAPKMENFFQANAIGKPCLNENLGCYFAFVSMSWLPYNATTNWGTQAFWEAGPIVWPSREYVSVDGKIKVSNGPRHPSGIVKDGYLYVFYIDHIYSTQGVLNPPRDLNRNTDHGSRRSGLKVMRAQLPYVSPYQWKVYYNGSFSSGALPTKSGVKITKENMKQFLSTPGPEATPLFKNPLPDARGSSETQSFSVAKIKGQNLYLGAEVYVDYQEEGPSRCPGMVKLALRTSRDLVEWSTRRDLYGCFQPADFKMNYARFYNKESTSNEEVDLNDFFLVGSNVKFQYHYLRVHGR